MLDPDKVTRRRGRDASFLNVEYEGVEVGHIRLDSDASVDRVWAEPWRPYAPVVQLLAERLGSTGLRRPASAVLNARSSPLATHSAGEP